MGELIHDDERQRILDAIRALADPQTGRPPSKQVFMARAGLTPRRLLLHFANYGELVRAAGLEYVQPNRTRTPGEMLAAYGVAVRVLRKLPNQPEFWAATRHHSATFIHHVGAWADAPAAFLAFASDDPQWADAVAVVRRELPRHEAFRRLRCRRRKHPGEPATPHGPAACASDPAPGALGLAPAGPRPLGLGPVPFACGAPLSVPGLAFCPVNEQGVVVLFALLAQRLGFSLVAVQGAFPDCLAQREVAPGRWQLVRIEFEYESRGFVQHRHPADGCDLLVCWRHNWPDCPPGLEVLELEQEVGP